jgi:hypothetical protein
MTCIAQNYLNSCDKTIRVGHRQDRECCVNIAICCMSDGSTAPTALRHASSEAIAAFPLAISLIPADLGKPVSTGFGKQTFESQNTDVYYSPAQCCHGFGCVYCYKCDHFSVNDGCTGYCASSG